MPISSDLSLFEFLPFKIYMCEGSESSGIGASRSAMYYCTESREVVDGE